MRGKLIVPRFSGWLIRIIPAHAGQTTTGVFGMIINPDHPRACGANNIQDKDGVVYAGSSPRMRGKPWLLSLISLTSRIIPAHAGQTSACDSSASSCPDHPRACGANSVPVTGSKPPVGSSPRMRGKLQHDRVHDGAGRIIPAHAGQTPRPSRRARTCPDHPRACGANCRCCNMF